MRTAGRCGERGKGRAALSGWDRSYVLVAGGRHVCFDARLECRALEHLA